MVMPSGASLEGLRKILTEPYILQLLSGNGRKLDAAKILFADGHVKISKSESNCVGATVRGVLALISNG